MRKLNVCRIVFEFPPRIGGSITHTINLARHMAPHCEQQFFIVPKIKEDTTSLDASFPFEVYRVNYLKFSLLQKLKTKYVKWLPVAPLVVLSFGLAAVKKCLYINKKHKLDIIHAHGVGIALPAMLLKHFLKIPAVLMLDGSLGSYSRLSGIYESMLLKITRLDHYFLVDNGGPLLPKARKLLPKSISITPVPINIDTNRVCPMQKDLQLAERLHVLNKMVFISIHNLEPIQGVEHSINGFKMLLSKYNLNDVVLLIVGDGSIRTRLEALVKELSISDRVIFVGAIPNTLIPIYYSLSDVALATSTKINMNTSTVEAMACGKPVVAFDCGNTSDQLIQDRERGILIKTGNIDELAKAMFLLYKEPLLRQKIGENARSFIVRERSWNKRIAIELRVYQSLFKTY